MNNSIKNVSKMAGLSLQFLNINKNVEILNNIFSKDLEFMGQTVLHILAY
jgi:hypothetical protein